MKNTNQRRVNYTPEGTVTFPKTTKFLAEETIAELAAWCDEWRKSGSLVCFIMNRPWADWKYFAKSKDGEAFQYYPHDCGEDCNCSGNKAEDEVEDGLYNVWKP